jgi:hypothetical protein
MEYVVFECDADEIPHQDWPVGNVIVCRVNDDHWACGVATRMPPLIESKGLFLMQYAAVNYAKALCDLDW